MIDLVLDPSETRPKAAAPQRRTSNRPWGRYALFGVLGLAGTGAFANVTSSYLSGLAGPQRTPIINGRKAADWPDLKDGLPALASDVRPTVREIVPQQPARPVAVEARIDPAPRSALPGIPDPIAPPSAASAPSAQPVGMAKPPAATVVAAKPLPAIVEAPVVGPANTVRPLAPARTVSGMVPLASETVRAKSGRGTVAALPPEEVKPTALETEPVKVEGRPAKPQIEPRAKPADARAKPAETRIKAATEKPAKPVGSKPAVAEAKAAPAEPQDEDAEVFGIKVPSFAPAGRKIRESVEALGDAVKGIPDRF